MRGVSAPLSLRIFAVYVLFVALGGWFVVRESIEEVKPAVRQSTEETLVDTAHLLAEIVSKDVALGTLAQSDLPQVLEKYGRRRPNAEIWGVDKAAVNHQIYVVDHQGKVLVDSRGVDVGKDYSQWRDVYLTLRGKYGARSTRAIANDESSTVMYVAAPIYDRGRIIGAVTVAKPNHSVQPFIVAARWRLLELGAGFVALGLLLGGALSFWLSRAVRRLTDYAQRVSVGERALMPRLPAGELSALASALDRMRAELDGQAYVERYVQTLTHELKSPLAAIRAASELLRNDLSTERRERFLHNIDTEAERLQMLSERLLALAQVEKRRSLGERQVLSADKLWSEVLQRFEGRLEALQLTVERTPPADLVIEGEQFLVTQALSNLLDNALDFTSPLGRIRLGVHEEDTSAVFTVWNEGPAIPDYALTRVTERFYSLPRPSSGRKSTGLGLNFVAEVAQLHGGQFSLVNSDGGVLARLQLPKWQNDRHDSPQESH